MEPVPTTPRHEAIDHDDLLMHEWRVRQLTLLGIPWSLAQAAADHVDWHLVATMVRRGLPAVACAADRPLRQSPMASSLPVQRWTGDALWARVARRAWCADSGLDPDQWYPVSIEALTGHNRKETNEH